MPYAPLFFLAILLFFGDAQNASANSVSFVDVGQHDSVEIVNPERVQRFYGELTNFPHLFVIDAKEEFTLSVRIIAPDIEGNATNFSGIVLRQKERGVEEIIRMPAKSASWNSFSVFVEGNTYRAGPEFAKQLSPGVYQIEVSTPENLGKYVLEVGADDVTSLNYLRHLKNLYSVKMFFEKSGFSMIESPLVYIPLALCAFIALIIFKLRSRFLKNKT